MSNIMGPTCGRDVNHTSMATSFRFVRRWYRRAMLGLTFLPDLAGLFLSYYRYGLWNFGHFEVNSLSLEEQWTLTLYGVVGPVFI